MKNQNPIIEKLVAHVIAECRAIDTDSQYDDMLNEVFSFDSVGGCFSHMTPSHVLKECDPVSYRCGKNDWLDGQRDQWTEVGNYYFSNDEIDDAKTEFIDALRDELSSLETDLEELENGPDNDGNQTTASAIEKAQEAIDDKQSEIDACEDYSF